MARDRGKDRERRARIKRDLIESGVDPKRASDLARGHAKAGTPGMREITAEARKRGEPTRGAAALRLERIAAVRAAMWPNGGAPHPSTQLFALIPSVVTVKTESGSDAYRALDAAEKLDKLVVIVATRADGEGIPVTNDHLVTAEQARRRLEQFLGEGEKLGPSTMKKAMQNAYPTKGAGKQRKRRVVTMYIEIHW